MATERSEHQQWADEQVAALIEIGIHPFDAQASVDWVLKHLPPGENPATYIFPANALYENPSSDEVVADARAAFYADDDVPTKLKRLLDAREESE